MSTITTWNQADIEALDKVSRLHLINSITGIKPANLVATQDQNGQSNVAIFSSIIHLGSQPPLLGFILRPSLNGNRHTYENIKHTGHYTINAVHTSWVDKAHYTSARFDKDECEFDHSGLEQEVHQEFDGIFVKNAPIQIGLKFREELFIKANDTRMIIGNVDFIAVNSQGLANDNQLDMTSLGVAGISGLNRYYGLEHQAEFAQAKVGQFPKNLKRALHE